MQKIALIGISLAIIISLGGIAYIVSNTTTPSDNHDLTTIPSDNHDSPVFDLVKDSWNRTIILVPRNVENPSSLPEEGVLVRIPAQRIVSFSPSITATLFNIGLGDSVVALTQFDDWPQEVLDKKENGEVEILENLIEPEVERILNRLLSDIIRSLVTSEVNTNKITIEDNKKLQNYIEKEGEK